MDDNESLMLPSKLYASYKDRSEEENIGDVDHESLLHDILSLLSTQGDIVSSTKGGSLDFNIINSSNINSNSSSNNNNKQSQQHCDDDDDIVAYFMKIITEDSLPSSVLFKYKNNNKNKNNDNDNTGNVIKHGDGKGYDSLLKEWSIALRYIHDLLPHIIDTPFEIHSIASQSILFSSSSSSSSSLGEDSTATATATSASTSTSTSHWILCLLLCTHSLQQCPSPLQKRWRRWQSLVCETLRLFQDNYNDHLKQFGSSSSSSGGGVGVIVSLWVYHIVPACLHVINQLPIKDSYYVAIFSGMVGITTNVLERILMQELCYTHNKKLRLSTNNDSRKSDNDRDNADLDGTNNNNNNTTSQFSNSLSIMYDTIQSISTTFFNRFDNILCSGNDELTSLWMAPYLRLQPSIKEEEEEEEDNNSRNNDDDDTNFIIYKDNISWWMIHHNNNCNEPQERIANMDTSISGVGLALLAMKAFHYKKRPMVYHPRYIWIVWFPHLIALLKKSSESSSSPSVVLLENESISFLQSLIQIIPEQFLVLEEERKIYDESDASSLELFHLLSNRLTARISKTTTTSLTATEEEDENEEKEHSSFSLSSSNNKEEVEFKLRSQYIVGLIKNLLDRFTTISRVQIVDKLTQNNSSIPPGLQARFLDLLRPIIILISSSQEDDDDDDDDDNETDDDDALRVLLWNLLMSIINNNLFKKYWNKTEQTLINVDDLINYDVEITIGAITMIQMWSSSTVKKNGRKFLPAYDDEGNNDRSNYNNNNENNINIGNIGDELQGFYNVLKKQLNYWSENNDTNNNVVVPHHHYRLFLLDSAISHTINTIF